MKTFYNEPQKKNINSDTYEIIVANIYRVHFQTNIIIPFFCKLYFTRVQCTVDGNKIWDLK